MCESQVDQPSDPTSTLPSEPNDLHDKGVPKTAYASTSTKPTALSLPPTQSTSKDSDHCTTHLPPINLIVDPTRTLGLQTNPIHILDDEEDRSSAPLTDASRPISQHDVPEGSQKRAASKRTVTYSPPAISSCLRNRFGRVRRIDAPLAAELEAAIQELKVEVDAGKNNYL